jgi:hypothetical protein
VLTRRRLTSSLIAAVAVVGLAAAGCAEQSAAVRVGDTTVSRSDFEAELDAFAELQGADSVAGELEGSYTQQFVASALGQRIEFILAEQMFDEQGLELTDADVADMTEQAGNQLDNVPRDLRRSLIEDVALRTRLVGELGQENYFSTLREAADSTDIEVSSRYGSWDRDTYTVVPPEGPAPASGGGSNGSDGDTSDEG